MADEAAEAAFISAMQNNNDAMEMMQGVSGAATSHVSEDEYEPALTEQPDTFMTDAQDPSVFSPSTAVKHVALSTTSTLQNTTSFEATTQELPDYDAQNESRSMSPESSDSIKVEPTEEQEVEDETPPGLSVDEIPATTGEASNAAVANGDSLAQAFHTASSVLPDSISTPNVPIQNDVQNRQSPEPVQNGVAAPDPAVSVSLPESSDIAQGNSTAETQNAQSVSQAEVPTNAQDSTAPSTHVPKARLPHDRIGILEDRIKDDPRGDTDAWLSLIAEHRKRGKLEEARKAYDRFLTVFPWAVSHTSLLPFSPLLTSSNRPNNGWRMHKWRMKPPKYLEWKQFLAGRLPSYLMYSSGLCIQNMFAGYRTSPQTEPEMPDQP